MKYEVIVGNVGTVLRTDSYSDARAKYESYITASQTGGRAYGEPVAILNGDGYGDGIVAEYHPPCSEESPCRTCEESL